MFHSCFALSDFVIPKNILLSFDITVHRLKFLTNVSVHINNICFRYAINFLPYSAKFNAA